jgi:hypothetical protein
MKRLGVSDMHGNAARVAESEAGAERMNSATNTANTSNGRGGASCPSFIDPAPCSLSAVRTDSPWRAPCSLLIRQDCLRSQIVTSKGRRGGRRYRPYAFTEQGVVVLSSVLRITRRFAPSALCFLIHTPYSAVLRAPCSMLQAVARPVVRPVTDN